MHKDWPQMATELSGAIKQVRLGAPEVMKAFSAMAQAATKDTPLKVTRTDDGVIVNLEDMKPQTLDSHCSAKPVRYVLEMNQGWFAQKGLKAGAKLAGAPFRRQ